MFSFQIFSIYKTVEKIIEKLVFYAHVLLLAMSALLFGTQGYLTFFNDTLMMIVAKCGKFLSLVSMEKKLVKDNKNCPKLTTKDHNSYRGQLIIWSC